VAPTTNSPTLETRDTAFTMPLGRRADLGDAKYAGVEVPFAHDMEDAMQVRSEAPPGTLRSACRRRRRANAAKRASP